MKIHGRLVVLFALALTLLAVLPSEAPAQKRGREFITTPMTDSPLLVTMKDWDDSRPGQRYAFLIGFMSMLDLEHSWQTQNSKEALPFQRSLVSSWAGALKAKSLRDIYRGLNDYVDDNPDKLNQPVTEVMWFTFVQPTVTEKLSKD